MGRELPEKCRKVPQPVKTDGGLISTIGGEKRLLVVSWLLTVW
jgi:hypothetical protein